MLIKKNGVSINLTESDLNRITNKVLSEGVKIKPKSVEDLIPITEGLMNSMEQNTRLIEGLLKLTEGLTKRIDSLEMAVK